MKWYEDPVYIKKCEKAEKIQEYGNSLRMDSKSFFVDREKRQIRLPRQDQLQEILVGYDDLHPSYLVASFATFCSFENNPDYIKRFTSMEQLWLAFVMFELYQKKWNGEDWIK